MATPGSAQRHVPKLHLAAVADERRVAAARRILRPNLQRGTLNELVALAAESLGSPLALLTVVTAYDAVAIAESEDGGIARRPRAIPLAHSLCKYVVGSGGPVVVPDAAADPALRLDGAVGARGARAYLGVPVADDSGNVIGALCVADRIVRDWAPRDLRVLTRLAALATAEIERGIGDGEQESNIAQMTTLLNTVDAVFWEADPETTESFFVSEQAERLLGYPVEEWLSGGGAFWAARIHPDDRETAVATSVEAVAAGRSFAHEYRMIRGDGATIWVRDLVEVHCDESGNAERLQGVMFDITAAKFAELERHAADERYRALVESAPNCTYLQDATTYRVTYMSPHIERMLGYSRDYWIGHAPSVFSASLHPDDRDAVLAEVWRCRERGEAFQMEYRMLARDGRIVWCYDQTIPIYGDDGEVRFRQGFLVDITEIKVAQEALVATETRHRAFLDHTSDLISVIAADGTFRFASKSHETLLGHPGETLVGTNSLELVHPDDVMAASAAVSAALDGLEPRQTKLRIGAADGTWRTVSGVVKCLDDGGGDVSAILIGRDVTAQLAAERERELRAAQLRMLAAASVELTSVRTAAETAQRAADLSRLVVGAGASVAAIIDTGDWNRADVRASFAGQHQSHLWDASAMAAGFYQCVVERNDPLRLSEAEVNARPDLRGSGDDAAHGPPLRNLLVVPVIAANGDNLGLIQLTNKLDGSDFTGDDEAMIVQLAQGMAAVIERTRLEERLRQSQKMDAIGQLAGGIAHDFNNVLTAINGYTEIATAAAGDALPEVTTPLREVAAAGERAAALTRQLLTFSRKHVINTEILQLCEVVDGLVPMLTRVIGEDVEIICAVDAAAAPVRADRGLVEQVILNLATNARDAMPGGGRLTIAVDDVMLSEPLLVDETQLRRGRYARLNVSDTGTGMDEATKARATEPFFTTKETGSGTGLGLATVHGIVGDSNAALCIESTVGVGTTVSVYFPAGGHAVQAAEAPAESKRREETAGSAARILVVEDEETVRSLVRVMLTRDGHDVVATGSPLKALASVESGEAFDLLITDVVMPEMSGPELVRALAQRCPPVLYTSGYTGEARTKHGLDGEDVAFLQKPFTRSALADAVARLLSFSERA